MTLKIDVSGGPGTWTYDNNVSHKSCTFNKGRAWSLMPQYRGVFMNVCQPDLLLYFFTIGSHREKSLKYFVSEKFYVRGPDDPIESAAQYVLWQKNQAMKAVHAKIHEEEKGQIILSTFRRTSAGGNQSKSIPGCLTFHAGAAFINEIAFQCTAKRLNGKHILNIDLSLDESKVLVRSDPFGHVETDIDVIIRRILGNYTQQQLEASTVAYNTKSASDDDKRVLRSQMVSPILLMH